MKTITAVITADWIDSSSYTSKQWERVLSEQKELLNSINKRLKLEYEIKRGDYLQVLVEKPEVSLEVALLLKSCINRIDETGKIPNAQAKKPVSDIRVSIGIGELSTKGKTLSESNGKAFQLSGKGLDEIKSSEKTIVIASESDDFNREMEVHLKLLEVIMQRWSVASAQVIYYYFQGLKRQVDLAQELKITQTSVSRRMSAMGMDALLSFNDRFKELVTQKLC